MRTGVPVETADFLPFGLTRNHSGGHIARHKYTDQEEDAETGSVQLQRPTV